MRSFRHTRRVLTPQRHLHRSALRLASVSPFLPPSLPCLPSPLQRPRFQKEEWSLPRGSLFAVGGLVAASSVLYMDSDSKGEFPEAEVRAAVKELLENPEYEDGSYGPFFVRLAWHAAGSYDITTGTGGSSGATMRYENEANHGGNAGLGGARDLLETIKAKFPGISYADLWSLAGTVAIEEMGGPEMEWRPGRVDYTPEDIKKDPSKETPDGRLPDAAQGASHLRDIFYRMGFSDSQIVALSGAHALGRCHKDRSGFEGPWTRSPTMFSNDFFVVLLEEEWSVDGRYKNGQFRNKAGDLMMLPSDMALIEDPVFRRYVERYAKDEELFFKDFATAWNKLQELGVDFEDDDIGFFGKVKKMIFG